MKPDSTVLGVALVAVLSFLLAMVVVQAGELKDLRKKLTRVESALSAAKSESQAEAKRIKGFPLLEGLTLAYELDLRGPDNIARLRHDLLQLGVDLIQTENTLQSHLSNRWTHPR